MSEAHWQLRICSKALSALVMAPGFDPVLGRQPRPASRIVGARLLGQTGKVRIDLLMRSLPGELYPKRRMASGASNYAVI